MFEIFYFVLQRLIFRGERKNTSAFFGRCEKGGGALRAQQKHSIGQLCLLKAGYKYCFTLYSTAATSDELVLAGQPFFLFPWLVNQRKLECIRTLSPRLMQREGSFFGFDEAKRNFGNIMEGLRRSSDRMDVEDMLAEQVR